MHEIKLQFLQIVLYVLLGNSTNTLVVTSLEDTENPPEGIVTLRYALNHAQNGDTITFAEELNGGTIELAKIGEAHSILKGEVMSFDDGISVLEGFSERDYGASALYARKNVSIDASMLPDGITLRWTGGQETPARVLAVYGNLTLNNVNITGGYNKAENISLTNIEQPWTLSRGCGIAVWGKATLINSEIYDNHCRGDFDQSRDRGAFGGGVYANLIDIDNSVISGNSIEGAGAAGGGVYTVGGPHIQNAVSRLKRSTISGNTISAIFTYGGGIYSDGGSIGTLNTLEISNSTIARNIVSPVALPPHLQSLYNMGYWRGGGVYASNGYLRILGSTIVENAVYGYSRTDSLDRVNLAGGVAATVGNAHAAEEMIIGQSIIAGNTVTELDNDGSNLLVRHHDVYSGSLIYFKSLGYNLIGTIDFSQILVPVGAKNWRSLSRKLYPKTGDADGVSLSDVINLTSGIAVSPHIISIGVFPQAPAVLYYQPLGDSLDKIPHQYSLENHYYDYEHNPAGTDNFLEILLLRLENYYNLEGFAHQATLDFENFLATVDTDEESEGNQPYQASDGTPVLTLEATRWYGPAATWPSEPVNFPYIEFYHFLDRALQQQSIAGMGPEILGEAAWNSLFLPGPLDENNDISIYQTTEIKTVYKLQTDQLNKIRPLGEQADIGAIEGDS